MVAMSSYAAGGPAFYGVADAAQDHYLYLALQEAAATGEAPDVAAGRYRDYGSLKRDVTEALVELLRPVQERHAVIAADPGQVRDMLAKGADRARQVASGTLDRAMRAAGFLAPPGGFSS
jgi:hypothetical protein